MNLIINRTQADISLRDALAERIRARTATPEEWALWLAGLQGAYNATDYNRVGEALIYLGGLLNGYGYAVTVNPKTNWAYTDVPTPAQQAAYLVDVKTIRDALSVAITVPPDMDSITYEEANDIERILVEAEQALSRMASIFIHSGMNYSGLEGIRS